MGKKDSIEHNEALEFYTETAKKLHRRVISLNDKSPDAIEIFLEDGEIRVNVIEIMHSDKKKQGKLSYQAKMKKELYEGLGFDEVKVYEYHPNGKVTKESMKRIPFDENSAYTCRKCGLGFQDMSKFQSHIYHEHTSKEIKI